MSELQQVTLRKPKIGHGEIEMMYVATNLLCCTILPELVSEGIMPPATIWIDFSADPPEARPRLAYALTPPVFAWLRQRVSAIILDQEKPQEMVALAVERFRKVRDWAAANGIPTEVEAGKPQESSDGRAAEEPAVELPRPTISRAEVMRLPRDPFADLAAETAAAQPERKYGWNS